MSRGLLTPAEQRAVCREEPDANKQSTYLARVKRRMDKVAADARLLREHRPDLYEQLHAAVCEEALDERITQLEHEVTELRTQLDEAED